MIPYKVDFGVPSLDVVLAGRETALRAIYREEEDGPLVAKRRVSFDPVVLSAPSGRDLSLEVVIDAERSELSFACLSAGFFDRTSRPEGLDVVGCAGWEIGGRNVAFQIQIAFPGSRFARFAPCSYDICIDDEAHFARHGLFEPAEEDLKALLGDAQAVFDAFVSNTPDLAQDVRSAVDRLEVDIMRREAFLLVEAAQVASQALLEKADARENELALARNTSVPRP